MMLGFPSSSVSKESACNAGDPGLIPGLGRSPKKGNGNALQYSCLENPMDRGARQATVHGVARGGYDLATKPPPIQSVWCSYRSFPGGTVAKNPPAKAGDARDVTGKIPWRRKRPLTPVFFPEKSMDRGAGRATVHGVSKRRAPPSG